MGVLELGEFLFRFESFREKRGCEEILWISVDKRAFGKEEDHGTVGALRDDCGILRRIVPYPNGSAVFARRGERLFSIGDVEGASESDETKKDDSGDQKSVSGNCLLEMSDNRNGEEYEADIYEEPETLGEVNVIEARENFCERKEYEDKRKQEANERVGNEPSCSCDGRKNQNENPYQSGT